jgi:hypothetical protein
MRNWTIFAVLIGLVLGGFPHAFCGCGCAGVTPNAEAFEKPAAPACPHCCGGDSAPTEDTPQTCKCATCNSVKAALVGSYTSPPSPHSVWRAAIDPAGPCAAPLFSLALSRDSGTEAVSASLPSGCALTILLGHLLL